MADRTESRITIEAPAAAVLDIIADFDAYLRELDGITELELTTAGAL